MCTSCEPGMVEFTRMLVTRRSLLGGSFVFAAGSLLEGSAFAPAARAATAAAGPGELVMVNGNFITMNPELPHADAIAVSDGRITAVGTREEVEALAGADGTVIDLGGKTVMPGFIDPHMHFSPVILDDFIDASADKVPTVAALQDLLRQSAGQGGADDWIRVKQYDPSIMEEHRGPTLAELDEAVPDRPVFIVESNGHVAYVNSAAFKLAGVDGSTKAPPTARYIKDEQGKLTGRLEEPPAFNAFVAKMPVVSETEMTERAMNLAKVAAAAGCTLIHDCGIGTTAGTAELERLQTIAATGSPVRLRGMLVSTLADEWDKMGLKPGFGDDIFRVYGVKAWSDGSNQARTGYMREPYLGTEERGALNYSPEDLTAAILRAHRDGWQVGVHANGDAGIDVTIDAFGKVLAEVPREDHRHRIEHCSMLHPEQVDRMAELGLSPSFLIEHVYIWGKAFQERILGPERVMFYDPCRTAIEGGLHMSLHSDYDVTPIRPLQKVETAVTRVMREGGEVLNPDERITREQAFRAVTIDAAWQVMEDANLGSIEVGKFADLVVLGDDPFEVPEDQISEVPIVETWLGGVKQG